MPDDGHGAPESSPPPRTREAEFTPVDANASGSDSATGGANKSEAAGTAATSAGAPAAQPTGAPAPAQPDSAPAPVQPDSVSSPASNRTTAASASERTAASGGTGRTAPVRGMATETPVKIAPPKEMSEYLVSVNNKTGLVVKIEQFVPETGQRKELSQADFKRVTGQLSTAARPLAGTMAAMGAPAASVVPPMLNAPAFQALAAQAAAVPPALSQLVRSLATPTVKAAASGQPGAMAAAATPSLASALSGQAATPLDASAVMQAYYQGVFDYLAALGAGR